MSRRHSDTRLLVVTGLLVLAAGTLVGTFIYVASRQGGSPRAYKPFNAGQESTIERQLREGGPYFTPDPFGGSRGFWFALERSRVVALAVNLPGTTDCQVRWRGSIRRFVDCHGRRLGSESLARYATTLSTEKSTEGALLVDLRRLDRPPAR